MWHVRTVLKLSEGQNGHELLSCLCKVKCFKWNCCRGSLHQVGLCPNRTISSSWCGGVDVLLEVELVTEITRFSQNVEINKYLSNLESMNISWMTVLILLQQLLLIIIIIIIFNIQFTIFFFFKFDSFFALFIHHFQIYYSNFNFSNKHLGWMEMI